MSAGGAEGGAEFGIKDPELDKKLDEKDEEEEEVNRTQPFQPVATSTPYNGGEQMEMKTTHHEQSGLPSYEEETPSFFHEETPLFADFTKEEKKTWFDERIDKLKKWRPNVNFGKLGPIGWGKKSGNENEIVKFGKRGGEERMFKKDGSGLLQSFIKNNLEALGPAAEQIIAEDRDTKKEMEQRKTEKEKELKEAETASSQIDETVEDIEVLRREIDRIQSRIDTIHDKYGSNLEMEAELRRLEQQKKNYETDLRDKKKELATLQKKAKNIDKIQSDVVRLGASISEIDRKKNAMQESLNQTKTLDNLKEQENVLQRQNAKDQAIIQDENASPSDKQAAEDRMAERNEELPRLQAQIAERERARPLLERVKEIFKKYGVTIASVVLAAGVTIGVVVSSITNALKASTKALGKGLKDIGAKLGSLLPGLIGSIANFLFKAAGQAIGFLAEHTWLLILAVVAFLFEKNLKKRR